MRVPQGQVEALYLACNVRIGRVVERREVAAARGHINAPLGQRTPEKAARQQSKEGDSGNIKMEPCPASHAAVPSVSEVKGKRGYYADEHDAPRLEQARQPS